VETKSPSLLGLVALGALVLLLLPVAVLALAVLVARWYRRLHHPPGD